MSFFFGPILARSRRVDGLLLLQTTTNANEGEKKHEYKYGKCSIT